MKHSSDNHAFWGGVFLIAALYYLMRTLTMDRFLFSHWVRVGFLVILGLRFLLLPRWKARSRERMIYEEDEMVQRIRLKSCRIARWASLLPLLIPGTLLSRWESRQNREELGFAGLLGMGLELSVQLILCIYIVVSCLNIIMRVSEEGGKK